MEPAKCTSPGHARRLADGALLLLAVGAAFSLGCRELFDADVWWHVRAGQWIWSHRNVPTLDPFTFASASRPWIDLHWLFQVALAAAYWAGGVRGIILMTSAVCAMVLLVALTARDQRWPSWVVAACWLPALVVMSVRFDPRPEVFSLLAVATYLAVLLRTDETPVLAWILPIVQVLWVNTQALFVLGPIILVSYLADRLVLSLRRPWSGRRWWLHVGGAAAAVGIACLANPYGLRGTLFPLELFRKITAWGGPYKSSIAEVFDLRTFVEKEGVEAIGGNLYFRAEYFLLLALPLSFIVPAVWRAGRAASRPEGTRPTPARAMAWLGVLWLSAGLILVGALGLPARGTPDWLVRLGRLTPVGLVQLGAFGALILVGLGRRGALLAVLGGVAAAGWVTWLRAHLFGPEPGPSAWLGGPGSPVLLWGIAVVGGMVAVLTLRAGGRLFRLLLGAVFVYLALQAIRNIGFFGLVAGFVMAWNLGEWAAELAADVPADRLWGSAGLAVRVALAGLIGVWLPAIVSDRFFRAAGESWRFGLREAPLAYAHEAAQLAGRPGLPDRALVFDLRQAGVYVFHNAPARKLFMDGRLEVPSRSTFETYLQVGRLLNEGQPGWAEPLNQMGDPLILLGHKDYVGAEATLLTDSDWRCIDYDAVASIFVRGHRQELDTRFPSVDFAARHFRVRDSAWQAVPPQPRGIGEAQALINLGSVLGRRPGSTWSLRFALMLLAGDRLRQAMDSDPTEADPWTLLGRCYENMVPDPSAAPLGPDEPWDPARGLLPAQAHFCERRALELDPRSHAHPEHAMTAGNGDPTGSWTGDGDEPLPLWEGREELARAIDGLLNRGRPEAAARLFAAARDRQVIPGWTACNRVAVALLQLGRPVEAGRAWEYAVDPPSPALRLARIAAAALAAQDYPAAAAGYRSALGHDSRCGEAWFGLALLHTQTGEAPAALAAGREGLRRPLTPAQTAFLQGIESLVAGLAPPAK